MSTIDPSDIKVGRRTILVTACATTCLAVTGCSTQNTSNELGATLGSAEVPISAVPVGGGVILADEQVVITQPQEGVFHAFSAVCTHQGCIVSEVNDGTINCPCHGSRYSIVDGSVVQRPAQRPLRSYSLSLRADTIIVN
ncbi:Rieske (2Fe-2S) protein [Rhodococcus globerulus]|uniref:Rieske (2Fe-2S) protein n=1 Tax=Rhodococcus globerulus TaxID=33008 RepID=UPI003017C6D5